MKKLFRIGFIFTLIMALVVGIFIIYNSENHFEERDILDYNDKLHLVEKALENGEAEKTADADVPRLQ